MQVSIFLIFRLGTYKLLTCFGKSLPRAIFLPEGMSGKYKVGRSVR